MNAERLRELVNFLIAADQSREMQPKADALESALTNLANQPNETSYQNEVVRNLDLLEAGLTDFFVSLTPALRRAMDSLKASPFFTPELTQEVRHQLANNGLTPSIVVQAFQTRNGQRREYVNSLNQLSLNLAKIGIEPHAPASGEAELGVLLPRELFRNELDPLSKELHTIHRIIAVFSEVATGGVQPVEVKEISTTDPVFFLGLDVAVVAMIAGSITWLLDTWERALKIKKLRNEAKDAAFDDSELKVFDDKVEKLIDQRVKERVDEMMLEARSQADRRQEMETGLIWAHRALLARIERGVTIEVRALPPLVSDGEEVEGTDGATARAAFATLKELAPRMEFPAPSGHPILRLPAAEPPKTPKAGRAAS